MSDSRRSRDPERWRRQLSGLARNNPRLAERLDAGELPGFAGPLEGTEHLHPEAAAAKPEPPPVPPPAAPPAPAPTPARATRPAVQIGHYAQEPDEPTPPPEPEPGPRDDEPDPAGPPEPPPARRGALGSFLDGFAGR